MFFAVLFNIWFYVLLILWSAFSIPLFSLFVLICRPFCSKRLIMRMFRYCISVYGRVIVSVLVYPYVRVRYRDFSDPSEKGPFVYICNHRSSSDPFLMSLLPGEIVQVVNTWPFRLPVWGPFARWAGYLSVREMPFEQFKKEAGRLLNQGVCIAAFPEGTRSGTRDMGPFHGALFRTCLEYPAVIVPVCIMGNEDKPRRGTLLLRPGSIRVDRLPGLPPDRYRHMTAFALKKHVHRIIQDHMRKAEGLDS